MERQMNQQDGIAMKEEDDAKFVQQAVVVTAVHKKKKSVAQPRPQILVEPRGIGPIDAPNDNDVLSGRGGRINAHVGNVQFRRFVIEKRDLYLDKATKKLEKAHIAALLVYSIRSLDPPGRFLRQESDGTWWDIGDHRAIKKVGQAMREFVRMSPEEDAAMQNASEPIPETRGLKRPHTPEASNSIGRPFHHPSNERMKEIDAYLRDGRTPPAFQPADDAALRSPSGRFVGDAPYLQQQQQGPPVYARLHDEQQPQQHFHHPLQVAQALQQLSHGATPSPPPPSETSPEKALLYARPEVVNPTTPSGEQAAVVYTLESETPGEKQHYADGFTANDDQSETSKLNRLLLEHHRRSGEI